MSALEPLRHRVYNGDDDDLLAREAHQHLVRSPEIQLIGELLGELRRMAPPWWSPALLRTWWPAGARMGWLTQRPDLRQRITTDLCGLPPRAARRKPPSFQADLIDTVVDEGDVTVAAFEHVFRPLDLATYGPAADFWRAFRAQLPMDESSPELECFTAWLIKTLLSDKGIEGTRRKPVLTALDVRTAIDGRVWHSSMPLDLRVAIDEARFRQERLRPSRPFGARHDLAIAMPEHIATHIPLADLGGVLDQAEVALGLRDDQTSLPLSGMPGSDREPSSDVGVTATKESETDPSQLWESEVA